MPDTPSNMFSVASVLAIQMPIMITDQSSVAQRFGKVLRCDVRARSENFQKSLRGATNSLESTCRDLRVRTL